VSQALCRLHARACLIAEEILWLLQGGFASGAMARWRTLHEIVVVGFFLVEKGQDVAERYLLHHQIESMKAAAQYQQHCGKLGKPSLSKREMKQHQRIGDKLVKRFGKPYRTDWGWAADALKKERPTFTDIEDAVSLGYIRPYFKLACYPNHAGCKGIMFDLGNPNGGFADGEVLLAGSSNAGIYDPAHCGAKSLLQATATLLLYGVPSIENFAVVAALQEIADQTETALAIADANLEPRARTN
jgi:hypothetical protein